MTKYSLNSKMQEALESAQLVIEQLKEQLDEENREKFNTGVVTDRSSALDMVSKLLDATMATHAQRRTCISTMENIFRNLDTTPVGGPKPWEGSQMTLREKNHQIHTFWMNEIIRQRQLEQEKGEKEQKLQELLNYRVVAMNSITKLKAKQFTRQLENQVEKRHLKMISDLQFAIDDFNRERKRISSE